MTTSAPKPRQKLVRARATRPSACTKDSALCSGGRGRQRDQVVEDKVLELQRTKRELADGILAGDQSMLGALDAADLTLLLS